MRIAIGSDHAGFRYKEVIRAHLAEAGHEVKDFGTFSEDPCDYPAFVRPVEIVDLWLATAFDGGRHERRIRMIDAGP